MLRFTEKNNTRKGFTIVELVSVIAVIAILAAILIPTFASIAEDAEQRALKMELGTVYTEFAADCGFRDEPVHNMDKYVFVTESDLQFSTTVITVKANGYRWDGNENTDVSIVAKGSVDTSASTAIYGPFNGYYLLGPGLAVSWLGSGTAASPYLVTSYQQLRAIAERVARGNTFSGKYFRLECSLTIANSSWLPIGGFVSPSQASTSAVFSGVFDGNGHNIALTYGRVALDNYCLFGYTSGATIKNLSVSGRIHVAANAGGIVGNANNTTVQNCLSSVEIEGDHHVGGIVGNATGTTTINGCMATGKVTAYATASDNAVGGIVGEAASGVKINDCSNRAQVTGMGGTVGGIAGITKGTVNNCVNDGKVEAKGYAATAISGGKDSLVGGIVGFGGGSAKVNACGNTGAVTGAYRTAGGIAGGNAIIVNAANVGTVTANGYVGGIMGTVNNVNCTVTNAMNAGTVVAKGENNSGTYTGPAGGIIGKVNSTSQYTVTLAVNGGQVQYRKGVSGVSYNEVGMIVGSANGKVVLTNNYLSVATGVYVGTNSATATAVGKSSGTSGSPTVQTNQTTLASDLNGKVGTNLKWTAQSGFFNGLYVPILTHTVLVHNSCGESVNTAFTGAANIYMPFPKEHYIVIPDGEDKMYAFGYWLPVGTSEKLQPGSKYTLTADFEYSSAWPHYSNTIKPVPFG